MNHRIREGGSEVPVEEVWAAGPWLCLRGELGFVQVRNCGHVALCVLRLSVMIPEVLQACFFLPQTNLVLLTL